MRIFSAFLMLFFALTNCQSTSKMNPNHTITPLDKFLQDSLESSDFISEKTDVSNSRTYHKKFSQALRNHSVSVVSATDPRCPSWWRYEYGPNNNWNYLVRAAQAQMRELLEGYPQETLLKCLQVSYILKDGEFSPHHRHKKNNGVGPISLVIATKSEKPSIVKGMVVSDFGSDMTGGKIYNQDLNEVCSFEFLSQTSAQIDCGPLGSGKAVFRVTNMYQGHFTLFLKTERVKVFATNVPANRIRSEFPALFN